MLWSGLGLFKGLRGRRTGSWSGLVGFEGFRSLGGSFMVRASKFEGLRGRRIGS